MTTYAYSQLVTAFKRARAYIELETRDFESDAPRVERQIGVDQVAYAVADLIAGDDPKFDSEAFLKEAGALPVS